MKRRAAQREETAAQAARNAAVTPRFLAALQRSTVKAVADEVSRVTKGWIEDAVARRVGERVGLLQVQLDLISRSLNALMKGQVGVIDSLRDDMTRLLDENWRLRKGGKP